MRCFYVRFLLPTGTKIPSTCWIVGIVQSVLHIGGMFSAPYLVRIICIFIRDIRTQSLAVHFRLAMAFYILVIATPFCIDTNYHNISGLTQSIAYCMKRRAENNLFLLTLASYFLHNEPICAFMWIKIFYVDSSDHQLTNFLSSIVLVQIM